ncbi:hypothetical protein [Haloplanus sp.]|uniref:hypothetical protein n=1 Tax=Haloplanus sp. TaxID=1961696 RepID=UPI0026066CB2|nr:hypothetical protein [Haloplanus sp.]
MRSGSTRSVLLVTVVICSVVFGAAAVATATEHYDVTSAGSTDIPDRTLTLDGQDFEIESVGHAKPGKAIEATTQAPDGKEYILYLYNNQVDRIDFSRMTGNDSASFPTEGLDPGTYVLVVRADREFQSIHPVVVAGYDPAVETTGEVTPGEPFTVEVDPDAEEYENAPDVDSITVVRTENGEAVEEVEATPVNGSDTYEAELTAPDEAGDTRLVTTVLGEESIAYTSEQEILGFTDTTLTEAAFEVAVDEDASTTEVTENETVEVVADIENTGDFTGVETVELSRDGDAVDEVSVSLNGGESDVVTLAHDPEADGAGELRYTVSSANGSDSLNVTVTEPDGEAGDGSSTGGSGNEPNTGGSDSGATDNTSADDSSGTGAATNETGDNTTEAGDNGSTINGTDDESAVNGTDDETRSTDGSDAGSEGGGSDGSETTDDGSSGSDGQSGESSDGGEGTIDPVEEEASPVSLPLTGVPQFIAAVVVIGLVARARKG